MTRFLAAFLAVAGLLHAGDLTRVEDTMDAMGSLYRIAAYGEDAEQTAEILTLAFDEVRRLDRLLSNYRRDSEWTEVNRHAAEHPVKVTPELFHLLQACVGYSRQSEGAFDITVGPLMKLWGFYRHEGAVPSPESIKATLGEVGYRYIELNAEDRTVHFTRPGLEIDPGGIGKGYAVDRVVAVLRDNGLRIAMVSAGGSSLYAMGAPPDEPRGWSVSIRNPKNPEDTIETVYLKDESMSTSGSYEKFFTVNGKVYSHIMDPRTGYPAEGVLSASVIAPRCLDSEAWTKPFFVNGRQWAERNKPKDFRVFLCEDGSELKCAWLQ